MEEESCSENAIFAMSSLGRRRLRVKYVGSKNQKEFLKDLKLVYAADTKEKAETELDHLEDKWGELYPIVIKSWRDKWEMLSCYFQYTAAIRKIIYTTNTVEGYHRQVRKITKTKGVFPNNDALYKLVYLAYRNIRKKWTMPLANWGRQRNNWPLNLETASRLCNFALPQAPRRRNTIENRFPPTEVNA